MHRVLIVEDDADINATLQYALHLVGYDVAAVLSGGDALDEIARRCPDLILLDQMLPDVDGVEICRQLRAAPGTRCVPIIFLTARAGEEARVKGLASGADDYVVKPFSVQEVVLRVRGLLRRSSSPAELNLAPGWLHCREQFRIWDTYAKLHLERGEWRDCQELCRGILTRCEEALSPVERSLLYSRLARCAHQLGDEQSERTWQELALARSRSA
jgi:DNA-binding response OmpR family regulator